MALPTLAHRITVARTFEASNGHVGHGAEPIRSLLEEIEVPV